MYVHLTCVCTCIANVLNVCVCVCVCLCVSLVCLIASRLDKHILRGSQQYITIHRSPAVVTLAIEWTRE